MSKNFTGEREHETDARVSSFTNGADDDSIIEDEVQDYSKLDLPPYPMDQPILASVNIFPNDPSPTWTRHFMRQAEPNEYESYLAMMPRKQLNFAAKGEDVITKTISPNVAKAANRLYNAIGDLVSGYEFDESIRLLDGREFGTGSIMNEVSVQQEIIIDGATDDELRQMLGLDDSDQLPKPLRVYHLIPARDKAAALEGLSAGTVERKRIAGRSLRLGARGGRIWTFQHLIGQKRDPQTARLLPPRHVIEYDFEEWPEKTYKRFNDKVFTNDRKPIKGGGGVEVTSTTNLRPALEIFDRTIRMIRGAIIGGTYDRAEGKYTGGEPVDVRRPEHLSLIPPAIKIGVSTRKYLDMDASIKN